MNDEFLREQIAQIPLNTPTRIGESWYLKTNHYAYRLLLDRAPVWETIYQL